MSDTPATEIPPNLYHLHLDICQHCRENPGSECEQGKALLKFSCTGNVEDLASDQPQRLSPFELVCLADGRSLEEAAQLKAIGKEIFGGAFARFL